MPNLLDVLVAGVRYTREDLHALNQHLGGERIPVDGGVFLNPRTNERHDWALMLTTQGNGHGYVSAFEHGHFVMTGNGAAQQDNTWLAAGGHRIGLAFRVGDGPHEYRGEVNLAGGYAHAPVWFRWSLQVDEAGLSRAFRVLDRGVREERTALRPVLFAQLPRAVQQLVDQKLGLL